MLTVSDSVLSDMLSSSPTHELQAPGLLRVTLPSQPTPDRKALTALAPSRLSTLMPSRVGREVGDVEPLG